MSELPFSTEDEAVEITLDTQDGLQDFAAYIHTQHEDFLSDAEKLSNDPTYNTVIQAGTAAYTELTRYVVQAEEELTAGETIEASLVALIQETYDEFIRVYELLNEQVEAGAFDQNETESSVDHASKSEFSPATASVVQSVYSQKKETLGSNSVITERFLHDEGNATLIEMYYGTPHAFEAAIWRIVRHIEKPQPLDTFLGVQHGSIFAEILKDQPIEDVEFFNQQPSEKIREALQIMELEDGVVYDYRIFNSWMNEFLLMKETIPDHRGLLFGELLAYALLLPHREL
jgi:hypothetical protein